MAKIGFIGMGNMGQAFARGLLSVYDPDDIFFSCKTESKKKLISDELGIRAAADNIELVHRSDIVILAIKPQMYEEVLKEISEDVRENMIIVSLAPGKRIDYINEALNGKVRVIRAMPDTPALIGYGVTGISYDEDKFNKEETELVSKIFKSVGDFYKVEEDQMSAVVCASGSSPAYVYMFIDELARSCEAKGLPYQTAKDLAARAVYGAAMMVIRTGEDPQKLKEKVCSKGGTTIEGIKGLEENGFSKAIWAATEGCYNRSEELG